MIIVEVTARDSEYCRKLVEERVVRFERTYSNHESSSMVGKMLSNSIACYREIFCETSFVKGKVHQCGKLHCLI
jgi:hypothetical protein